MLMHKCIVFCKYANMLEMMHRDTNANLYLMHTF